MAEIKFRGGAQIGLVRSSWPFCTLVASKERIIVNAPLAGRCVFGPEDVVAIEPIPDLLARGLRIRHCVKDYKENVEFLTLGDPQKVIDAIRGIGFPIANHPATSSRARKEFL